MRQWAPSGRGGWEDLEGAWPSPTWGDLFRGRGPRFGQSWVGGTPEVLAQDQFLVWRRAAGSDISTDRDVLLCLRWAEKSQRVALCVSGMPGPLNVILVG